MTLWPLEQGLTISEALLAFSFMGFVVFALELPTSGFADAFGRRPVYIVSAVVNIASSVVVIIADSFWSFAIAGALFGLFRALDSGPLEAWYVDTVHVTEPGADVDQTLAAQSTVLGASIAVGSVLSGVLIAWDPLPASSALLLPLLVWAALNVVHLLIVVLVMREPRTHVDATGARRAAESVREAPVVIREGLGMLRTNRVLRGIVLVEIFWSTAHGRLRDVPADPAGRARGRRGAGGCPDGAGRGGRLGRVRTRLRAGRTGEPPDRHHLDRDPVAHPQRPGSRRDGSGRRTGRPHRGVLLHLRTPRHRRPDAREPPAP